MAGLPPLISITAGVFGALYAHYIAIWSSKGASGLEHDNLRQIRSPSLSISAHVDFAARQPNRLS